MALTAADRQRRYRRHRAGDHSLCDNQRCNGVTPSRRDASRGERLWADMRGDSLQPMQRVLLEEACRLADRLDRLDAFLRGEDRDWLRFHSRNEDGSIVEVVVDKALSEARQQATALKQLVGELRLSVDVAVPTAGGSAIDQLAARRAARQSGAAGP